MVRSGRIHTRPFRPMSGGSPSPAIARGRRKSMWRHSRVRSAPCRAKIAGTRSSEYGGFSFDRTMPISLDDADLLIRQFQLLAQVQNKAFAILVLAGDELTSVPDGDVYPTGAIEIDQGVLGRMQISQASYKSHPGSRQVMRHLLANTSKIFNDVH